MILKNHINLVIYLFVCIVPNLCKISKMRFIYFLRYYKNVKQACCFFCSSGKIKFRSSSFIDKRSHSHYFSTIFSKHGFIYLHSTWPFNVMVSKFSAFFVKQFIVAFFYFLRFLKHREGLCFKGIRKCIFYVHETI